MAYVGKLVQGQFRVGDKGTSTLAKSLKSSSTPHGLKLFECKFKFRNKAWRILWDRTPMLSKDQTSILSATFRCGAPTEGQMKEGTAGTTTLTAQDCTTTQGGTVYPVPAPTGRDAKIVECTLPAAVPWI